ncbi:MAG: PEPxxWA-CTERM sorting domain-containing protein [Caulobacteraceae bacterium]
MKVVELIACVAVVALSAGASRAADLITNGSFETNGPAAGSAPTEPIGSTAITGWTAINNDGTTTDNGHNLIWIGNGGYGLDTPFGTDFLDLTGTTDTTPFSGVSQTVTTVVGQAYALTFYLGVYGAGGAFGGPISATANAGSASQTFTDPGGTGGTDASGTYWTPYTLDFTASAASTVISFVGTSGDEFIGLDNVSLNPTVSGVPEPVAWALMLAGLGMIGFCMRRRRGTLAVA